VDGLIVLLPRGVGTSELSVRSGLAEEVFGELCGVAGMIRMEGEQFLETRPTFSVLLGGPLRLPLQAKTVGMAAKETSRHEQRKGLVRLPRQGFLRKCQGLFPPAVVGEGTDAVCRLV
jgi:hypothetical protein